MAKKSKKMVRMGGIDIALEDLPQEFRDAIEKEQKNLDELNEQLDIIRTTSKSKESASQVPEDLQTGVPTKDEIQAANLKWWQKKRDALGPAPSTAPDTSALGTPPPDEDESVDDPSVENEVQEQLFASGAATPDQSPAAPAPPTQAPTPPAPPPQPRPVQQAPAPQARPTAAPAPAPAPPPPPPPARQPSQVPSSYSAPVNWRGLAQMMMPGLRKIFAIADMLNPGARLEREAEKKADYWHAMAAATNDPQTKKRYEQQAEFHETRARVFGGWDEEEEPSRAPEQRQEMPEASTAQEQEQAATSQVPATEPPVGQMPEADAVQEHESSQVPASEPPVSQAPEPAEMQARSTMDVPGMSTQVEGEFRVGEDVSTPSSPWQVAKSLGKFKEAAQKRKASGQFPTFPETRSGPSQATWLAKNVPAPTGADAEDTWLPSATPKHSQVPEATGEARPTGNKLPASESAAQHPMTADPIAVDLAELVKVMHDLKKSVDKLADKMDGKSDEHGHASPQITTGNSDHPQDAKGKDSEKSSVGGPSTIAKFNEIVSAMRGRL